MSRGRYNAQSSYNHQIIRWGYDDYSIEWTYDRYIAGSRQRWPTTGRRHTDKAGAERFAKKWGIEMPGEKKC